MKIKILESAKQDLREGFDFYEAQQTGIGSYLLLYRGERGKSLRYSGLPKRSCMEKKTTPISKHLAWCPGRVSTPGGIWSL